MLGKIEKKVIEIVRSKLEIRTTFYRQDLVLTTSAIFDGIEVHTTTLCLNELVDEILKQVRNDRLGIVADRSPTQSGSSLHFETMAVGGQSRSLHCSAAGPSVRWQA